MRKSSTSTTLLRIVCISTKNIYVDKAIVGYDRIAEGDFVVLTVSDDGIGIDENDLQRIFEPFYTKRLWAAVERAWACRLCGAPCRTTMAIFIRSLWGLPCADSEH